MQLSSNLKKRIKKTLSLNLAVFWGTGEKGMVCTSTYEFLQGHNSADKKWPMSPGWCLVLVNWFTWSSRQLRGYSFHLGPFLQACLSHSLAFQFTSFPLSLETPHRTSCELLVVVCDWTMKRPLFVFSAVLPYSLAKQPSEWHFSWQGWTWRVYGALSTGTFPRCQGRSHGKAGLGGAWEACVLCDFSVFDHHGTSIILILCWFWL